MRRTTRRLGRGARGWGEGQSRGPRSPLRDFPTRTWVAEPRPRPGPGMWGGANPQDRLNHLQTGRGGWNSLHCKKRCEKDGNSVIRPGESLPFYYVLSCPLDTSFPCTRSKLRPLSTPATPPPRRPARLTLLAENGDSLPSGPLSEGRKCRFVASLGLEGSWKGELRQRGGSWNSWILAAELGWVTLAVGRGRPVRGASPRGGWGWRDGQQRCRGRTWAGCACEFLGFEPTDRSGAEGRGRKRPGRQLHSFAQTWSSGSVVLPAGAASLGGSRPAKP